MSTKENDAFLEGMAERFRSSTDASARRAHIQVLRNEGFDAHAELLMEEWHEERVTFLNDHGISEADVLEDEDGEYYMDEIENGNPSEDGYDIRTTRENVPPHLTNIHE